MAYTWSRPTEDLPYPKVWCRFTARESKNSDRLVNYWIQDLPEDRFDDAIQHVTDYYLVHAPISTFLGKFSLN